MPIIIPASEIQQGTDEWHQLRLGIPTSSQFKRILTMDGDRSKSWQGYIDELTEEAISGKPNKFESWEMRLGHEQEPKARWLYSQMNDVEVEQVAFIYKDERRRTGCSTDGLVGDNGVWECKGGKGTSHIARLRDHEKNPKLFPNAHFQQIQGELYICEREWCDLFGFFPGMRPIEVRVYRDEKWIKALDTALEYFFSDLEQAIYYAKAN